MRLFQKYVILARFDEHAGLLMSVSTGKRYICILKMHSYVAIRNPFLSRKNIPERIVWARNHEYWTQTQWSNVIFTEEYSF